MSCPARACARPGVPLEQPSQWEMKAGRRRANPRRARESRVAAAASVPSAPQKHTGCGADTAVQPLTDALPTAHVTVAGPFRQHISLASCALSRL